MHPGKPLFFLVTAFIATSAWACFAYADLPAPEPVVTEACADTVDGAAHGPASMAVPWHLPDSNYHWFVSMTHSRPTNLHNLASLTHLSTSDSHIPSSSMHWGLTHWQVNLTPMSVLQLLGE